MKQSNSNKQNYFLVNNERKAPIDQKKLNGHKQLACITKKNNEPLEQQFAGWHQTSKHVTSRVRQTPLLTRLEGRFKNLMGLIAGSFSHRLLPSPPPTLLSFSFSV